MTTIDVQSRYLVHATDRLDFVEETAFRMLDSGTAHPSLLINAGSITASFSHNGTAISSTSTNPGAATFWNKEGAVLSVTGAGGFTDLVTGFELYGSGSLLRNDGQISVNSESSAIGGSLRESRVVNNGNIEATSSSSDANALSLSGWGSSVLNRGLIQANGEGEGASVGLVLAGLTKVVNIGEIVAEATDDALGIDFRIGGGEIRNSGVIRASENAGAASIAIRLGADGDYHLLNTGLISAKAAILAGGLDSVPITVEIVNSGVIQGSIQLAHGDDVVRNSGVITGDGGVALGAGADSYLGQHAQTSVLVYGGSDADRLLGGAGDDLLYGDGGTTPDGGSDGDDLLRGGRGHDSLYGGGGGDALQGGADADVLTGGADADIFLFGKLSDSAWSAPDLITDLEDGDVINLSGIDADKGQAGDQAFHLVAALSGQGGEAALSYDRASGLTRLELDVDGDGHADAVIAIAGDATAFTGFVL